jgi:hypothetical protein
MSTSLRQALKEDRRKKYLSGLINEAIVQIISEQDAAAAPAPVGMPAPAAPPVDASAPAEPTSNTTEFTVDDMIERLNVVRGGRSFTDPEVYGQLVTFFKTLNDEQKTSMQKFLMDLGKIVINVNDQEAPPGGETSSVPPAMPPAPAAAPVPATPAAPPPTA